MRNLSGMNLAIVVLVAAAGQVANLTFAQTDSPRHVWTFTGLERVLRDSPPGPNTKAMVRAARNEWESFQIALRSAKSVRINDIVAGPLRGPSNAALPAGNVHLYREHQLHITVPSYRNDKFQAGWYPDALIPFRHPMTGERLTGGRFRAVPFDLPADETHAFWVDLHIPRDATPGHYVGEFNIQIEGGSPMVVPVEIEVWGFALPERATMFTEMCGTPAERMRRYYDNLAKKGVIAKPPDYGPIREQCARLETDHRLNSPPPGELVADRPREDGSFDLTPEQLAGLRRWAEKYHLTMVSVPPPSRRFKDPVADRDRIHRWLKSWDRAMDAAGLGDRLLYTYLLDEPNDAKAYETVQQWGKVVRESGSRVKVLVTEQTKTQDEAWGDLYGAVDIWVPLFPLFDPDTAAARQKLGEQIWCYTALCQGKQPTPWWQTDFPILNYRVPAWIAWRYEMKGILYWAGLSFWYHVEDPWTDPMTYQPGDRSRPISKRAVYNGEGLLVYPARDVGFDGVVPSMRLKALRDGLEDFDYLALLETRGLREKALEIVMPVAGSWNEWAQDPAAYLAARERLAKMILEGK